MNKMSLRHLMVPRNQRSAPRLTGPGQMDNRNEQEGAQCGTISTKKYNKSYEL